MVVEFEKLNLKERQLLVLKNLDGTFIQPLVYAHNLSAKLLYNETSEIEFELPAYVDGEKTPHYDDVVGMRLIDWIGVGQFILINPKIKNDGVSEIKSCTAYSLEYEFTYKNIYIPEGTYNFWDPMAPKDTVLGRILELMPSWSPGNIDSDLWDRYRTFEVDNQSIYEFMKGTAQDSFQCIFDFDTYKREINVRSVANATNVEPVYLSMENLIKEIQIEEDTENIVTCLDVNGAEGVDIRSVNPTGTNEIYNLDYFMNETYFPSNVAATKDIISNWERWKKACADAEAEYYSLTIKKTLKEAELESARAELIELKNELSSLETMQSAYVAGAASGSNFDSQLADVKEQISGKDGKGGKKGEITKQENSIKDFEAEIEKMYKEQVAINDACAIKKFFFDEEYLILDRYFKKAAISEESFIYKEVSSYDEDDVRTREKDVSISIVKTNFDEEMDVDDLKRLTGGTIVISVEDRVIEGKLIDAVYETLSDGSMLLTARLGEGKHIPDSKTAERKFISACLTVSGTSASDSRVKKDDGWSISVSVKKVDEDDSVGMYFTVNPTEFGKRSVEWDLMDYGSEILDELAYPTYTFSIDSGNFLAMEDFEYFKNHLALGSKIYLNIKDTNLKTRNAVEDGRILTPIVIGVEFDCDDPEKFKLLFGDKYSLRDSAFQMVDLLKESVSMGKTVASNKTNYNAFLESGASTQVKDFMNAALNAAKNAVLAGENQSVSIDGSGIRLRKWNKKANDYDPQQIWMINNNIVFTEDNWGSAAMAIGSIVGPEGDTLWGVVADALVGKLVATNNLVVESEKSINVGEEKKAVFRMDGSGASLYNADFTLYNPTGGTIVLSPDYGVFAGGSSDLYAYDDKGNIVGLKTKEGNSLTQLTLDNGAVALDYEDLPNANFWVDMNGNAFFKGNVYAENGYFNGEIHATGGTFTGELTAATGNFDGTVNASSFSLDGVCIDKIFSATPATDKDPSYLKIGDITIDGNTGTITWDNMPDAGMSEEDVKKLLPDVDAILENQYKIIKATSISGTSIESPVIKGNDIQVHGTFQTLIYDEEDELATTGYVGAATGRKFVDTDDPDYSDKPTTTTYGIAMSTTSDLISFESVTNNYVIVTDAGVRLQAWGEDRTGKWAGHAISVTPNGAFYDGNEISIGGSGSITLVAKWG